MVNKILSSFNQIDNSHAKSILLACCLTNAQKSFEPRFQAVAREAMSSDGKEILLTMKKYYLQNIC